MRVLKYRLAGMLVLTLGLAACASDTGQVRQASSKSAHGLCAANFTLDDQGRRSARLIRDPEADSGFVSGRFAADIKVWVTAPGAGTKLVTLHATPADEVLPIPVERITAVALQSCEVLSMPEQDAPARVLTTSN